MRAHGLIRGWFYALWWGRGRVFVFPLLRPTSVPDLPILGYYLSLPPISGQKPVRSRRPLIQLNVTVWLSGEKRLDGR